MTIEEEDVGGAIGARFIDRGFFGYFVSVINGTTHVHMYAGHVEKCNVAGVSGRVLRNQANANWGTYARHGGCRIVTLSIGPIARRPGDGD